MLGLLISCAGDVVVLEDRHQAEIAVELSPDPLQVLSGLQELSITVDQLGVDSLGRQLEVAEIVELQMFVFPELGLEEVARGLGDDTLIQSDVGIFLESEPGEPLPLAEEFAFLEGEGTWLLAAVDAQEEVRRMAFLIPSDEGVEELDWRADSAQITVDLSWGEPLAWGAVYDWSGVTVDVQGRELLHRQLDRISAARVELDLEELASRFIELEELATERVDADLEGQVKLSADRLPGFEPGAGWVMGLSCASCSSPVPRVLVRMEE
jgi:hypothetical protein